MAKYYSANKISQYLDISVQTLNSWYKWYNDESIVKPPDTPFLPPYEQASTRGKRLWSEDYLYDLRKFKEWIPKGRGGVMGDINARCWGERGVRAQKNKALKKEE